MVAGLFVGLRVGVLFRELGGCPLSLLVGALFACWGVHLSGASACFRHIERLGGFVPAVEAGG